jgi:DNA repair exonuclease SbcCD ATPase subunit
MDTSVERAHDELLRAMPAGARHNDCPICDRRTVPTQQEVAGVADDRTFTEKEHEALVTDAVRREVASATEETRREVAELQSKLDVLESEKAAAEQRAADAEKALEDYKAEQARVAEVAAKRDERVAAIKEVSAHLPDTYFTDERVGRWAEMADDAFDTLVEAQAETSIAALPAEEAKLFEGLEGEARRVKLAEVVGKRKEAAGTTEVARETAAFGGGVAPSSRETADDGTHTTTLGSWLHRSHAPSV